jgi:hypothetical protein
MLTVGIRWIIVPIYLPLSVDYFNAGIVHGQNIWLISISAKMLPMAFGLGVPTLFTMLPK